MLWELQGGAPTRIEPPSELEYARGDFGVNVEAVLFAGFVLGGCSCRGFVCSLFCFCGCRGRACKTSRLPVQRSPGRRAPKFPLGFPKRSLKPSKDLLGKPNGNFRARRPGDPFTGNREVLIVL